MLHVPRSARIFVLALLLITLPSIYLFYTPSFPDFIDGGGLDKGGIDSDHIREPVVPHWPNEQQKGDHQQHAQKPVFEDEEARDDEVVVASPDDADTDEGVVFDAQATAHTHSAGAEVTAAAPVSGDGPGKVIMPYLGNATAKAELGRATWRFLHTMTLRFPDKPSKEERETLKNFFYLFSQLYPCGECASHFQKMLAKYPPQTSSRMAASLWLCSLHNIVNERIHKPQFDCMTLDATYDCGCNGTSSAVEAAASQTPAP